MPLSQPTPEASARIKARKQIAGLTAQLQRGLKDPAFYVVEQELKIWVPLTPQVFKHLKHMLRTGLHGRTVNEVAERLISEGCLRDIGGYRALLGPK
jgi:hypothetical protein